MKNNIAIALVVFLLIAIILVYSFSNNNNNNLSKNTFSALQVSNNHLTINQPRIDYENDNVTLEFRISNSYIELLERFPDLVETEYQLVIRFAHQSELRYSDYETNTKTPINLTTDHAKFTLVLSLDSNTITDSDLLIYQTYKGSKENTYVMCITFLNKTNQVVFTNYYSLY